jgi:uncharacterized SAM-binding protein YcdF (DUF218 family)
VVDSVGVTFVRRHPILTGLLLAAFAALALVAASAVAVWRAAHTDDASVVDDADTILVLGAAQYGGRPSPVFRGRLDHAAHLYRNGFSDRVVVLGAGQPGEETTEAQAGVDYLVGHQGMPGEAVSGSPVGRSTYESLVAAARYMREEGLRTAFVVSDPWHNLRVKRMARDLGIEAYASATFRSAATTQRTRFAGYVRETFAYLYYRVVGR